MKLRYFGFVFLGLAWAAVGCSKMGCEGSRPPPALTPGSNTDRRPPVKQGPRGLGGIDDFSGPHNGLSPDALKSPALLAYLGQWKQPLTTVSLATAAAEAAFDDAMKELYPKTPRSCGTGADSCAAKLMGYIVSCALDKGTSLDLAGKTPLHWTGELGVCGIKAEDADRWAAHAPTKNCLEAVSACVLARVNARDLRVAISLLGKPDGVVPKLRDRVPLEPTLREKDGTVPIVSLSSPCLDSSTDKDPKRDCGWASRYVGRCTAGAKVTLDNPMGVMVRVCKGIHGCDHDPSGSYYGQVTSVPSTATRVSFQCPSPTPPRPYYYFGIMVAAPDSSKLPEADTDVTFSSGADYSYPAKEAEVFTYREGAFYGNIFEPLPSPASPASVGGDAPSALLGGQYACYSDIWNIGIAELTGRMCAVIMAKPCFGNPPHRCLGLPPPSPPAPADSCGSGSGMADAYLDCKGFPDTSPTPTGPWPRALTVMLNDPCDFNANANASQGCAYGGGSL